ncbi:MAG: Rpn family recombination-promoting nuclease/putative transposase [Oscillospiraceae bacterium]|nr:Rpn family recombination-promoting nuclease/putative transposase [Oscillospiraceae bacterium]
MRRYDRLASSYQVTFCSYTVFPQRRGYCNAFSLRHDEDNGLLCDAIHIIFVELSKLQEILKKSVEEMTDLEKWAIFFRYADSERSREKVNEVIASKEELQMAGELLMSISKDERERAVFRSRRMYQTDLMSNLATAEDRGLRRGVEIGKREGIDIGKREGIDIGKREGIDIGKREGIDIGKREGARDAMIKLAKKMLGQNRSVNEIADYTELSIEEIEKLRSGSV